jgi:hypothetical protein
VHLVDPRAIVDISKGREEGAARSMTMSMIDRLDVARARIRPSNSSAVLIEDGQGAILQTYRFCY